MAVRYGQCEVLHFGGIQLLACRAIVYFIMARNLRIQEGLAVASIARDDPSTLPGDDPFPRARMHRDRNAQKKLESEFET